ncbi:protein DMR6-LIKE OXYGENASE 2-like [Phalaenopsis equestris]|uniref:protein DMR6-LIKE OXYGENASE 2-like n=1 Tax=Phalaenopsis equestris TaxID=78828 RepID=UPI0009E3D4E5|nr:protein DMR6-LIKE OXYGENASE 2-like [Phalaenopsis equestris]
MTTSSQNSTVKELLDSNDQNVTTLPSHYITRSPTSNAAELIHAEEIPTIDFSLLKSKSPCERAKIVQKLGQACENWGCFMVANHGVPEELRTSVMEAFAAFFDLPAEEKEDCKRKQLFDSVVCGTSFNPTVKGVSYWRDFLRIVASPIIDFPKQLLAFRLSSQEFARQTREIVKELMRGISESLELEANYMEEFFNMESCHQAMVGNLYPPCPQPELALGLPPHSDAGILTLLMQNSSFPGLQVMHHGKWVPVQLIPSSFFVIVADFVEIFSNGKYRSALHRSVVDEKSTRISVLTSIGPPLEGVEVAPAPKLIKDKIWLLRSVASHTKSTSNCTKLITGLLHLLKQIFSNGKYRSALHRSVVDEKSTRISVLTSIGPPLEGVEVAPAPKLIQRQNMAAAFRGITYKEYVELHQTNQLNKSSLAVIRLGLSN